MSTGSDFSTARDAERIDALAAALGLSLQAGQRHRLARYVELVVQWNRKLDLTAARGATAQLEVLLADAFVLARPELLPHAARCVDVGSGAGAPALPVLLLRDDLRMTLVEPLRKRVAFLRTALGTLGLVERARVLEAKLDPEDAPAAVSGEHFDVALSRATFAPELWLQAGTRLATRTLVLLAAQAAPPAPSGTRALGELTYRLPSQGAQRCIASYELSSAT